MGNSPAQPTDPSKVAVKPWAKPVEKASLWLKLLEESTNSLDRGYLFWYYSIPRLRGSVGF